MPTTAETGKTFAALVENGLGFIERSAKDLQRDPTSSIAHFATGLEVLLKARLFAEHWTLIALRPHDCQWLSLMRGDVLTVAASDLCAAIITVTGGSLREEQAVFGAVFRHRNRVVHWLPPDDLAAVAAEQCHAWYRLHRLLIGPWKALFVDFAPRIRDVEKGLRLYHTYLQTRFDVLKSKLDGLRKIDAIDRCPSCGFDAAELKRPVLAVSPFVCEVCETDGHLAQFPCGARVSLYELPTECECGVEHTRAELAEFLDPHPQLSPKDELLEPGRPHCGECLDYDSFVVHFEGGYLCLGCGARFAARSLSECGRCGADWVGYATEDSHMLGCELCGGYSGHDD